MTRIVVKVGSSTVTTDDGRVDEHTVMRLCEQVASLTRAGCQMVVVSSGAIACGWAALGRSGPRPADPALLHEVTGEVELGPSLDGSVHRLAPVRHGDLCQGGQAFPTIEGPGLRGKAVPAPIGLLGPEDPVDRPLDHGVVPVADPNEGPHRVPGGTDLAGPTG